MAPLEVPRPPRFAWSPLPVNGEGRKTRDQMAAGDQYQVCTRNFAQITEPAPGSANGQAIVKIAPIVHLR